MQNKQGLLLIYTKETKKFHMKYIWLQFHQFSFIETFIQLFSQNTSTNKEKYKLFQFLVFIYYLFYLVISFQYNYSTKDLLCYDIKFCFTFFQLFLE